MAMENPPFENVFPVENGACPASHVSFQGCNTPIIGFSHANGMMFHRSYGPQLWCLSYLMMKCTSKSVRGKPLKYLNGFVRYHYFGYMYIYIYPLLRSPHLGSPPIGIGAIGRLILLQRRGANSRLTGCLCWGVSMKPCWEMWIYIYIIPKNHWTLQWYGIVRGPGT